MLLWPEQSQTSPTRTSRNDTAADSLPAAVTVSTRGAVLAGKASSDVRHRPSASAIADVVCPANVTAILAPGSASPQMGTGFPCCRTMWSPKMAGSVRACAGTASSATTTPTAPKLQPERLTAGPGSAA